MVCFDFTDKHTDLRAPNNYSHTQKNRDRQIQRDVDFGGKIMGCFQITHKAGQMHNQSRPVNPFDFGKIRRTPTDERRRRSAPLLFEVR